MQNREDGHKGQRLGGDPSKKICPLLFFVPITEYTAWVISKSGNDSRGQEVQDEGPSTTAFSVSYWRKARGARTSYLITNNVFKARLEYTMPKFGGGTFKPQTWKRKSTGIKR